MNNPKAEEIVEKLRKIVGDLYFSKSIVDTCVLCDTIDLIEQLQQELADERYRHDRLQDFCVAQGEELSRLKAQQRWIPVTERLPEESGRYLTRERFGTDILSYEVLKTKGKWKTKYKNVTHWMPLPVRPEEDNHDANN